MREEVLDTTSGTAPDAVAARCRGLGCPKIVALRDLGGDVVQQLVACDREAQIKAAPDGECHYALYEEEAHGISNGEER